MNIINEFKKWLLTEVESDYNGVTTTSTYYDIIEERVRKVKEIPRKKMIFNKITVGNSIYTYEPTVMIYFLWDTWCGCTTMLLYERECIKYIREYLAEKQDIKHKNLVEQIVKYSSEIGCYYIDKKELESCKIFEQYLEIRKEALERMSFLNEDYYKNNPI